MGEWVNGLSGLNRFHRASLPDLPVNELHAPLERCDNGTTALLYLTHLTLLTDLTTSSPHLFPLLRLRRFQHGIAHVLRFQRIPEGGAGWFAFREALKEVGDLMNERVLVTDLQARHPPFAHVGMVAVADVDAAPAAQASFVAMLEVLQPVQIVQVPGNGSVLAVDLESVEGLVAAGVAG